MAIYKVKRFSFWGKTKAGLKGFGKGAKYGAIAGAVLVPGNVTLALLGKKKAAAITTAVGAGLGAGIGGYIGAKDSIDRYNYNEKLEKDPEFREKELKKKKEEVNDFIKTSLNSAEQLINSSNTINDLKKIEKDYSISFNSDLFSYVKFYEKFCNKNYKKWYNSCKDLIDFYKFDINFSYIFPNPDFSIKYDDYRLIEFEQSIKDGIDRVFMVAGNISNSDHSFLYYHFDDNTYSFDLGSGFDSNSISKTISNFTKRWKVDLNKVDRNVEGLYKMTSAHNQIIDEFLIGLKQIK